MSMYRNSDFPRFPERIGYPVLQVFCNGCCGHVFYAIVAGVSMYYVNDGCCLLWGLLW